MKTTPILNLHQLKNLVPDISDIQCDYFVEACIVALEGQGHKETATLSIKGDFEGEYQLKWDDKPLAKGWREPREIAEYGGIAIAFFLTLELTAYQIIEQSIIGTGFDYWLGF